LGKRGQSAYGLLAQIELYVDRCDVLPSSHGADHVAEGVLEARLGLGAFAVVEEPIDGLQMTRALVFLAQRVVDVDEQNLGRVGAFCFGNEPSYLMSTQARAYIFGSPRTDP
jgi:hypothetical protein